MSLYVPGVPLYIRVLNKAGWYWRLFFPLKPLFTLKHSQLRSICFLSTSTPFGTKSSLLFPSNYSFPRELASGKVNCTRRTIAQQCGSPSPAVPKCEYQETPYQKLNSTLCGLGKGIACTLLSSPPPVAPKWIVNCTKLCLVRWDDVGWWPQDRGLDWDHAINLI